MGAFLDAFIGSLVTILPIHAAGFETFTLLLLGVLIGAIAGIVPGIGGILVLALLLPYIGDLNPVSAFALLLGAHAVVATTSDLTSVLFGVPGDGTSAATVVDGHQMTLNGEAGRALGAALMSSLIGAVFGALLLALAIPAVAPLVLLIGSPEYFMLILLGIYYISALSGEYLSRGILVGLLGLALSMVGLDPLNAIPRYTLEPLLGMRNSIHLWDGFHIVHVTLGLFAVPEIVSLINQSRRPSSRVDRIDGIRQGIRDAIVQKWLVLRCSAIGAFIGVIPGLGGSVAQWVAYGHAKQSSPSPETFGKGNVGGVLGPGAANNSKEGGSLVPTLAFGVPGSPGMALLLGAFIMLGLVPGPEMLDPDRELTLTFAMVWIVVIANVIAVVTVLWLCRFVVRVVEIDSRILASIVMVLVALGTLAVRNNPFDLIIVAVFGAIGLYFKMANWPRPPLLLGLILGGLAENKLFISISLYGYSWLMRPGVLIIAGLIIILIAFHGKWSKLLNRQAS